VGTLIDALEDGKILIVDELDASLHPKLSSEVVQIFHDPRLNMNGAQLIFNTHDPSLMGALLGDAPLRRDEVWLTEKGRDGGTRLYPLTDFRPRKAENLERGYLQGRYGGVPYVDNALAHAALRLDRGEQDEKLREES
jgi:AAA15 family ATPase/GTPase